MFSVPSRRTPPLALELVVLRFLLLELPWLLTWTSSLLALELVVWRLLLLELAWSLTWVWRLLLLELAWSLT